MDLFGPLGGRMFRHGSPVAALWPMKSGPHRAAFACNYLFKAYFLGARPPLLMHSSTVLNAVKFLVCLNPGLVLSWQIPAFDFFTSGSASTFAALAAGAATGAALAAGALAAGVAALTVPDAVALVWACTLSPASANNAAIKLVFNMDLFPMHGDVATML